MKKPLLLLTLLAALTAHAVDTAYTTPVGGFTSSAAANTDTRISPTLTRETVWSGTIASTTSNALTANGTPNWSTDTYLAGSSTYYARMLSGALEGQYFIIVSNTTDTLTVDTAGMDLALIASGDRVEIAPFWTLGTLFPSNQAGTAFIATTSIASRQTEILVFDGNATGINRSSSAIFFFYNGAWRKVGSPITTSFDSTVVFPDTFFIQRNKSTATSLVYTGRVQPVALGTVIEGATGQHDNFIAISFPVNVTLDQSGLAAGGFTASTSVASLADQLLWFDPAGTGINRSATDIYFYYNGAWRKKGAAITTDFGPTLELKAGSGFIIRKKANGASSRWKFTTGI